MGIEWWLGMVLYVVVTIPWKRFQSSSIVHSIAKPTLPDDIYSFSATRWRIRNQKWLGLPSACSKQFPPSYQPIELALVFARFPFHDKLEVPPPFTISIEFDQSIPKRTDRIRCRWDNTKLMSRLHGVCVKCVTSIDWIRDFTAIRVYPVCGVLYMVTSLEYVFLDVKVIDTSINCITNYRLFKNYYFWISPSCHV